MTRTGELDISGYKGLYERAQDELDRIAIDPARALSLVQRGFVAGFPPHRHATSQQRSSCERCLIELERVPVSEGKS